jgi:hypothetical protein
MLRELLITIHSCTCYLQVEGLQGLTGLLFLDISHNILQQLDARHLAGSIKYLKVSLLTC